MKNLVPRWLLLSFTLVAGSILAGGYWFYRAEGNRLWQRSQDQLQAIAELKVAQIFDWRRDRLRNARSIMENPADTDSFIGWLDNPRPESAQNILKLFRSIEQNYLYANILLIDAQQRVRLSLNDAIRQIPAEAAKTVETAIKECKPALSDLFISPDTRVPTIAAIAPFYSRLGAGTDPVGAVILLADARRELYPIIQSWPVPSSSAESLLVRREADSVLYMNELRHRKDTTFNLRIPINRRDIPAVEAVLGKEGIFVGNDYRNIRVLAGLRRIPDSSWFLIAKMDESEAMAARRDQGILILALITGMLIALLGGTGMIWQRGRKEHYQELYREERLRVKAEEARETLLKSLQEKTEEMEALLYISSHDLRSPLVNIQGFSQRLAKAAADLRTLFEGSSDGEALRSAAVPIVRDRIPGALHYIVASAAKMDGLIAGMLRLSRLGRIAFNPVWLDINQLVKSSVVSLGHQAELAKAGIRIEPLPDCWGEAGQISQVFTNLIDNALKCRDPNRPLSVQVRGEVKSKMAVYCIEDNGVGIKIEHQSKVWQSFTRLDPHSSIPGEGLGLTVVKRIVQRHGGRAWLESVPGKGSMFYIALPREKPAMDPSLLGGEVPRHAGNQVAE